MSDLHLGIDPGQRGGFAALSPLPGLEPIAVLPSPMYRPTKDSPPQLNVRRLVDWVLEIYPRGDCHVWVERCPDHFPHIGTMRSVAISSGKILGIFEARFPHMVVHRIRCGRELAGWQRAMLGNFTSEESKQKALERAKELWPNMQWPLDGKGRPLDGPIDAALCAEYGRRKLAGEAMPSLISG
jgi:hypothetical protein